ncbi:hypothetical protein JZ751_008353, partial [Albula glossodonta]
MRPSASREPTCPPPSAGDKNTAPVTNAISPFPGSLSVMQNIKPSVEWLSMRIMRVDKIHSVKIVVFSAARRVTPHLEEALNQIQGPSSSSTLQASFYRNAAANRGYSSSPSSSAGSSGSRYQKQLSAAVAYAKLMQERSSGATLKSSQLLFHNELQETQRLLEDRQINSLQEFQREVDQLGQSESLSSLDSLENERPHPTNAVTRCASCSSSDTSEVPNCTRPQSPRKHLSSPCIASETTSCQAGKGGDDFLRVQNRANTRFQEAEGQGNNDNTTEATGEPITDGQKPASSPSHEATSAQNGIMGKEVHQGNVNQSSAPGKTTESRPCKAWASPDPEPFWLTHGDAAGQKMDMFSNHLPATRVVMPTNAHSNLLRSPGASQSAVSETSVDPENSDTKHVEKTNRPSVSCPKSEAKMNSSSNADCTARDTQPLDSGPSTPASSKSYQMKVNKGHELDAALVSALTLASGEADSARSVKGILKKESKYATHHAKLTFSPLGCSLASRLAVSIRDSVELAKQRDRESVSGKGVRKKLRWFDEVHLGENEEEEEEEEETRPARDVTTRLQAPSQSRPSNPPAQGKSTLAGQQERPIQGPISTAMRPTPPSQGMTPITPGGPRSARQAWLDGSASEEKGTPRRGRPRGPRRVRSARARLGAAPPKTRKGVAVRPQSASEASQVTRQGRLMVPRPPPKSGSPESRPAQGSSPTEEGTACADVQSCGRSRAVAEQPTLKDAHEGYTPPQGQSAPFPPTYALSACETLTKATYVVSGGGGQQEALGGTSRRGPLYLEHTLSLGRTPTEEEISQLWHGVRNALAHRDGDPRNLVPYNGLLSGLSQARTNLSHVTIDGGNLISGIKAITRMGGFFVTTSNAKSTARRKQSADGNKHRALLEQRRLNSAPGPRKPPAPNQTTVQISPLGSTAKQISGVPLQDEVSESTEQFLLAETLADSSATDADILAAMETTQTQTQMQTCAQRLQRLQTPGPSALSLEEHRLLLSLEHLNNRLQTVQEAAAGSNSVLSTLQLTTPANVVTRLGEGQGVT